MHDFRMDIFKIIIKLFFNVIRFIFKKELLFEFLLIWGHIAFIRRGSRRFKHHANRRYLRCLYLNIFNLTIKIIVIEN